MKHSPTNNVLLIESRLRRLADAEQAQNAMRFFKTGQGQYGEGDIFLGIKVPALREVAKQYPQISLDEAACLLGSQFHEERMVGLFLLVNLYKNAKDDHGRKAVYLLYLDSTRYINNWDLVDCSAEHIVGAYLRHNDKQPLYDLAHSDVLWQRRIAIISTFHFIKHNEFAETLKIAQMLLRDKEDLIHKAVGWMLREAGKRDIAEEEKFLKIHYRTMPRTMLRYAIERFPEQTRQAYLKGNI